jgi:hypothetical protein
MKRLQISDAELIRYLQSRDGDSSRREAGHRRRGVCRYRWLYPGGEETCPWCEAERVREELAEDRAA